MTKDKVSVIVPVYNVEKWLRQCIESVLHQTYENIELLLINDGSTDQSSEICNQYQELDSRVKVIHKKNSGVSDTRNVGIEYSTGEYIIFLDSDDYLEDTMIEKAIEVQKMTQNELVIYNFALVKNEKRYPEPDLYGENISIKDIRKNIISSYNHHFNIGNYMRAVIGKLFLSSIIKENHIRFSKEIYIGEDALFLLEYTKYMNKLSYINTCGYNYRILNSSAVRRYKNDLLYQNKLQIEYILRFLKENQFYDLDYSTALTVLSWTLFRDNLKNDRKADKNTYENAIQWFNEYKYILCDKNVNINEFPNVTKMQYKLSSYVPVSVLCMLTCIYFNIKK